MVGNTHGVGVVLRKYGFPAVRGQRQNSPQKARSVLPLARNKTNALGLFVVLITSALAVLLLGSY